LLSHPIEGVKVAISGTHEVTTPSLVSGGYTVAIAIIGAPDNGTRSPSLNSRKMTVPDPRI
jgi:hypothetical protein